MAQQFPEVQVHEEKKAIDDGLRQIRSAIVTVRAKLTDFEALKAKWDKGMGSTYAKADVDKLAAILAGLKQFTPAVDAFLASNLGA